MAVPELETFARAVLTSRLLDRPQLEQRVQEFRADTRRTDDSAKSFAQFLVATHDLTAYQAERLLAGRTGGFFIRDFKILSRLGAGGMGKVYLAEQLKLGRQVAFKVLAQERADDAEFVARFQREARAVAQLKHPNIVQVYDVGHEGRTHYIVMELVRGKDLGALLKAYLKAHGRGFAVAQVLTVVRQVATGLQHAHEHGIVHRDIKPANLVLEGETVKILDLGLARRFDSGDTVTREGQGMGTPDYMSPEQFQDAHQADARSDIYSLGCTWYALLAGRPPFPEPDLIGKALAHRIRAPEPIQKLLPEVPDWMTQVLAKMLAKPPRDRYQNCGELLADIDRRRVSGPPSEPTATVAWTPEDKGRTPAPPADVSLQAVPVADSQTLVQRPATTTVPMVLVYLLPVMAALVLGGVYYGVQLLRQQLSEAEPIIVEVPAARAPEPPAAEAPPATAEAAAEPEPAILPPAKSEVVVKSAPESKPAEVPQPESAPPQAAPKTEPDRSRTVDVAPQPAPSAEDQPAGMAAQDAAAPAGTSSPEPRAGIVRRVGTGEGMVRDLAAAWEQSENGDRIEIAQLAPLRVGLLEAHGKRVSLFTSLRKSQRPLVLFELPPAAQAGRGLWSIVDGGLSVEGIDFYVDLTARRGGDAELVLFELQASDLRLSDTSITVVTGPVEGRTAVTVVKCGGERPWDATARGDAPVPIEVDLRDSLIRGAATALYLDSRQAVVRVENTLVCGPGTLLHLFHTRPLESAHHRVSVEVGGCTLDLGGPCLTVDCRPYNLSEVPLEVTLRSTLLIGTSEVTRPAQVAWNSPIEAEQLSAAIRWKGVNNCYVNRGDGLQAKSAAGPVVTYVELPADWLRLGLGEETNWLMPTAFRVLTGPWDRRSVRDYAPYLAQVPGSGRGAGKGKEETQVGADAERVPEPRRPSKR